MLEVHLLHVTLNVLGTLGLVAVSLAGVRQSVACIGEEILALRRWWRAFRAALRR